MKLKCIVHHHRESAKGYGFLRLFILLVTAESYAISYCAIAFICRLFESGKVNRIKVYLNTFHVCVGRIHY